MATAEWVGFEKLVTTLDSLERPDPTPLLEQWEKVIVEDNRAGVLSGLDKDGNPAPPLRYRNGKGRKTAYRKQSKYGGFGKTQYQALQSADDNLSTAEYRKLTGPRLA